VHQRLRDAADWDHAALVIAGNPRGDTPEEQEGMLTLGNKARLHTRPHVPGVSVRHSRPAGLSSSGA